MALYLAFTYLLAAIPFGLVITTLYGGDVDVRASGSGNIGATNVARLYGWRLAGPVAALDVSKGCLPVALGTWLWADAGMLWGGLLATMAFIGHCFPVYLEFKGGKGVATSAGALLGLAALPTLAAAVVWMIILAVAGRSSVAALSAGAAFLALAWWLEPAVLPVGGVLVLGVLLTHVANIRRLVAGKESEIMRPVRWGRRTELSADEILSQGPGGGLTPPLWREAVPDPLAGEPKS